MLIINAVTETTSKGEAATPAFLWAMAEQYELHFPQVADTKEELYTYANSTTINLPFHLGVDLRSMKIVNATGVKGVAAIEQLAKQTLTGP